MVNQKDKVIDKAVSIDSKSFKDMVSKIRKTEKILGSDKIKVRNVEKKFLFLKTNKLN